MGAVATEEFVFGAGAGEIGSGRIESEQRLGRDDGPGERVQRVVKNFTGAGLQDGDDRHRRWPDHIFHGLAVEGVESPGIERRASHLPIASGDDDDGDGVRGLDDGEHVGQGGVKAAGFFGGR